MQVQLIKNTNINGDAKLIENDKCLTLKNMQFYIKATLFQLLFSRKYFQTT